MTALLGSFTEVAAWMWSEVGLLLKFIIAQPILQLAMSLFLLGLLCLSLSVCFIVCNSVIVCRGDRAYLSPFLFLMR